MENVDDPLRYRVTRVCRCSQDYAEGYGPTVEAARERVKFFWRRDNHRERDILEEYVEVAVIYDAAGSSRYVPVEGTG